MRTAENKQSTKILYKQINYLLWNYTLYHKFNKINQKFMIN